MGSDSLALASGPERTEARPARNPKHCRTKSGFHNGTAEVIDYKALIVIIAHL